MLTTLGHILRKISKVSSIFIAWWYELTFISNSISSYSMCSCDHLKKLAKKNFEELNAIRQSFLLYGKCRKLGSVPVILVFSLLVLESLIDFRTILYPDTCSNQTNGSIALIFAA